MNKIIFSLIAVLTFMAFSSSLHARKKELVDPTSIQVPENMSIDSVDNAVWGAIIQKNWVKENQFQTENGQVIETAYFIRTHKIALKITYTANSIDFAYLGSENMKYKEKKNKRYIHPNYMQWSQNLANQIKTNIELGSEFNFKQILADVSKGSNPAPKEPFANFSQFKLEAATLAKPYQGHKGNESTVKNLNHNLQTSFAPKLETWKKEFQNGRTLIIKPHIEAVRFIGTGARIWVGAWAGRSWILVKTKFIDEATNEVIAEPELFRMGVVSGGFSGAKYDYKMVEDMANDIKIFAENNYNQNIGGGRLAPLEIRQQILTE